jgi:hypothetical protein
MSESLIRLFGMPLLLAATCDAAFAASTRVDILRSGEVLRSVETVARPKSQAFCEANPDTLISFVETASTTPSGFNLPRGSSVELAVTVEVDAVCIDGGAAMSLSYAALPSSSAQADVDYAAFQPLLAEFPSLAQFSSTTLTFNRSIDLLTAPGVEIERTLDIGLVDGVLVSDPTGTFPSIDRIFGDGSPVSRLSIGGLLLSSTPCTQSEPPVLNYQFPSAGGAVPRGVVSADGTRVAMFAVPNDAAEDAGAELAVFNPFTGELQFLTSGTPAGVDIFTGEFNPYTQSISGLSRDGGLVAVSGSARFNFPSLTLPGDSAPRQYREVIGFPGQIRLINTSGGSTQVIGALADVPLEPNQVYIGQVNGISADASRVLVEEAIVNVEVIEINGVTRRIVPDDGGFAQIASGVLDVASGTVVEDIVSRLNAAAGGDAALFANAALTRMSGDGNAFLIESARDLADPLRPFWSEVSAGGANIQSAPYVYFLDEDAIVPVVDIDTSQTRIGGSSFVFLRNIGFTGTRLGIERGASYIGAPPNPSGANAPATVQLGEVPLYVVPPSSQPPARGFFANSFALVSPEEDRVYFQHTADLVPGSNPNRSPELFSIGFNGRDIRQISAHQDTLGQRFADEPELLFQYGDRAQLIYAGSSADHRVVAYTNFLPDGTARVVKDIDAQGRTVIRAARLGTAEFPASAAYRVMVCN